MKFDPLNVQRINDETLPEASKLANELLTHGADAANQLLTQGAAILADTLTEADAIAGRALDRAEALIDRLDGMDLKGNIGGMPFEAQLTMPGKKPGTDPKSA